MWLAICYSTPKKVCEGLIYLFYLWVKYVGNYQHDLRKNAASLGTMEPIWLEKCVFVKKNWRISYLVMFGAEISTSMLKIKIFHCFCVKNGWFKGLQSHLQALLIDLRVHILLCFEVCTISYLGKHQNSQIWASQSITP